MKMFEFNYNRSQIRETEKAYGFAYDAEDKARAGRWYLAYEWLPKSQVVIEDVEFDGEDIYWSEGDVLVSVPMWLASKRGFFKTTLFKEQRCY